MIQRKTVSDNVFDFINILIMCAIILMTLYPLMYVIFASISDPSIVRLKGGILFWPVKPTIQGYRIIFNGTDVYTGYKNTAFYVVVGTSLNLFMTSIGAYTLSRKNVLLKKYFMLMIVITMYFSGGLIPSYFVVRDLNLINKRMALIIPGAVAAWNLIIMRTAFASIPEEMEQSARIDGANDFIILFRIILPLSTSIIAVMALFYGVGHWNSWFSAVLYLRDRDKFPIQLFLRELLILNATITEDTLITRDALNSMYTKMLVKYSITVVATLPILVIYPFLQKYFVKGVMIGSLKG